MQRRYNFAHLILASAVVLALTVVMVCIDVQARIAFESDRDQNKKEPHDIEIYVMDADGGNQQRLTNNLHDDSFPSWSPDGKRIVFSARRSRHFENELEISHEIYVMDADGKNQKRLTDNCHDDQYPSWSPDGKRIVFHSNRDGNYEICVMDIDGGNQQRLTNNSNNDVSPAWFGPAFAVAPAGKP